MGCFWILPPSAASPPPCQIGFALFPGGALEIVGMQGAFNMKRCEGFALFWGQVSRTPHHVMADVQNSMRQCFESCAFQAPTVKAVKLTLQSKCHKSHACCSCQIISLAGFSSAILQNKAMHVVHVKSLAWLDFHLQFLKATLSLTPIYLQYQTQAHIKFYSSRANPPLQCMFTD